MEIQDNAFSVRRRSGSSASRPSTRRSVMAEYADLGDSLPVSPQSSMFLRIFDEKVRPSFSSCLTLVPVNIEAHCLCFLIVNLSAEFYRCDRMWVFCTNGICTQHSSVCIHPRLYVLLILHSRIQRYMRVPFRCLAARLGQVHDRCADRHTAQQMACKPCPPRPHFIEYKLACICLLQVVYSTEMIVFKHACVSYSICT